MEKLLRRLEKLHVSNPDKSKDYEFGMDSVKAYIFTQLLTGYNGHCSPTKKCAV